MTSKAAPKEVSLQDVKQLDLKSGQYFVLLSKALQGLPPGQGQQHSDRAQQQQIETQGPTYAPQGVGAEPREGVPKSGGSGWTRRELGRRFGVVFDFEIHRQPLLSPRAPKKGTAEALKPKPAARKPSNPPVHIYLNLLPLSGSAQPVYLSLTHPPTPKRKQVKIQTDDALLAGLWAGKVTPQAGYASGRLRVGGGREGGLEKVQELGSVLRDELERMKVEKKGTQVEGQVEDKKPAGAEPSEHEAVGAPSGQAGWGWGLNGGVRAKL